MKTKNGSDIMFGLSRELVKDIKEKYPACTRVRCISMPQEPYPVPSGTIGTVTCVDAIGTIHVNWDNHSPIGRVPDVEQFEVVEKKGE